MRQLEALSEQEKREVIGYLEASLDLEISPEVQAELDRRWAEFQANPEIAVPWSEFKHRLETRLQKRSPRAAA